MRHQLAVLDLVTGGVLDYRLRFTGDDFPGIWDIDVAPGNLRLGGGFNLSGTSIRRYAAFATWTSRSRPPALGRRLNGG